METKQWLMILISLVIVGLISHSQGYSSGYTDGNTAGYTNGYSEGKTAGYNSGYNEGNKTGYNSGYEIGKLSAVADVLGNAERLLGEYQDKLNLVDEIQKRTDALGTSASKSYYVEWQKRNTDAISMGEILASYIREHSNELNTNNWATDTLSLIATNKERLDRDNQNLIQIISQADTNQLTTYYSNGYNAGQTDEYNRLVGQCLIWR